MDTETAPLYEDIANAVHALMVARAKNPKYAPAFAKAREIKAASVAPPAMTEEPLKVAA